MIERGKRIALVSRQPCAVALARRGGDATPYQPFSDRLYLRLGDETPDGVSELSEGVNLDTAAAGRLVGIEILDASKRFDIRTILSYVLDVDKKILQPA